MTNRISSRALIVTALLLNHAQVIAGSENLTGNQRVSDASVDRHSFVATLVRTPRDGSTVSESSPQVISIFTGCNGCEYQPVLSDNGNWRQAW